MRVDKFLWCVRKYKTRSLASEAVKLNKVSVNNEVVKPSRIIKINDEIQFKKEGITYAIAVTALPKSRLGAKLVPDYIKDITSQEELDKRDFMQMMQNFNRDKGTGRPTKKERRDLDDFTE